MWHARDPRSIIQAAEKAAEAGNHASAEHLLREAARLQEASLGPHHPDLANTLNNLGIVCEITNKPVDAEQFLRRAVTIATTSLAPDHPFVTTSRKNLRDFCEARGKIVDAPAPPVVKPQPPVREEPEDPEATSRKFFTRVALGALGPIAMLMVVLAAGLPRLGAPELTVPSSTLPVDPPRDVAPPLEPAPVEPIPASEETTPSASSTDDEETASPAATPAPAPSKPTATSSPPVVVRASLCGDLDDWSCDPADSPVPTGPLYFYTQIKSPTVTTVQHRWYQDGRLIQAVDLRVQPNRSAGYRTYSRTVMKSESSGNWRVEVRSEDGALLHEERFMVR
jgi:hypothetical protein